MSKEDYQRWDLKRDNHAWAFYYYLKRKGDDLLLSITKETLIIWRKEDDGV